MSDRGNPAKVASRILRERAMAILRDTRSKIDPALLEAMKEKLSGAIQVVPQTENTQAPLKQGVFKREYKEPAPVEMKKQQPPLEDEVDENGMVPVDRQKIAQIVLQYMKNRHDKQKH